MRNARLGNPNFPNQRATGSSSQPSRLRLADARAAALVAAALALAACGGRTGDTSSGRDGGADAESQPYELEAIVPMGSPFHGVHGLRFDDDDNLYAASVIGQSLFTVDTETGSVETLVGPREGMADDIAIAADGTFVWTAIEDGILYARAPDGAVRRVLEGYKGVNAVSFHPDGRRLFLSLVFYGDALYEVDLYGGSEPRLVAEGLGGLNAFEVSSDGYIYGPLVFGGRVVRIDPETGETETVSDDFVSPGALKLESDSSALVLDDGAEIKRVDLETGETTLLSTLPAGGDNLAIDSMGRVFVSLSETNAIIEIDARTGAQQYLVEPAPLNSPTGFAATNDGGRDMLYVGDLFGGIKIINGETGGIQHAPVELFQPAHIAVTDDSVIAVSQVFGTIQRLDRTSFDVLETWEGFDLPADVLALPGGGLVVAETGSGRVLRVTATGEREVMAAGLAEPTGLARASGNAIYVSETADGRILRIGLADGSVAPVATGLAQPEGLAVSADGRVIAIEVAARRLVAIDPDSGDVEVLASDLPVGLSNGPSLYRDVEASGDSIYFNSDIDNTIYRLIEL